MISDRPRHMLCQQSFQSYVHWTSLADRLDTAAVPKLTLLPDSASSSSAIWQHVDLMLPNPQAAQGRMKPYQAKAPGAPPCTGRSAPSRSMMSVCSLRLMRYSWRPAGQGRALSAWQLELRQHERVADVECLHPACPCWTQVQPGCVHRSPTCKPHLHTGVHKPHDCGIVHAAATPLKRHTLRKNSRHKCRRRA